MDLRTNFITWYYNEFHFDPLFVSMAETVEGSPHHREENVGVHTDMVVGQYISRTQTWDRCAILGAIAAAFHDVGKPGSRERKWKEERGWYNKFAGHELMSARLWEDWAVRNWNRLSTLFQLTADDLYYIGSMIEHHLPYDVQKQDKFDGLVRTTMAIDPVRGPQVFTTLLESDVWGRISDDMYTSDGKVTRVADWTDKFIRRTRVVTAPINKHHDDRPTVTILVGPSGAGKSTAVDQLADGDTQYFSLDDLRLSWYSNDYNEAFELACADKQFNNKAQDHYRQMLRNKTDVIVDNTNGSRKRRRFYVNEAHNRGYNVRMVIMPAAYQQLLDRQLTRNDKTVPATAVHGQYMKMNYPVYDEADQVVVLDHNLEG